MIFFGREAKQQIDNLKDSDPENLHLQTVGGKIWVTERGVRDIEVARLCCGGQGELHYSKHIFKPTECSREYGTCRFRLATRISFSVENVRRRHIYFVSANWESGR